MSNEVIFLTEAGSEYGYGHLIRCLAIAQGFDNKNIDSIFYIRGDSKPEYILDGFQWEHLEWIKKLPDIKCKKVILDSYYAEFDICKKINEMAEKVLFIDDYNRILYPGGMVLNSVICAEKIGYLKNDSIEYLLGPKYHPLRKEFWNIPEKIIYHEIKKVLITFGGSDISNETPNIIRFLNNNYPDLEQHVVIGSGFKNISDIYREAAEKTILIIEPGAELIKEKMLECDLAISAAGQTIYELARVGVPTIAKKVVSNQTIMIKNWADTEFILDFDIHKIIPDYEFRKKSHAIGCRLVDGKGVGRIVEVFLR